jgi:hypothetical protein
MTCSDCGLPMDCCKCDVYHYIKTGEKRQMTEPTNTYDILNPLPTARRNSDDMGVPVMNPTNEQKARYIVERTGGEWEPIRTHFNLTFLDPDGRIQLLELMMGREDWPLFVDMIIGTRIMNNSYIHIDYITDKTGLLLDAAWGFLRGRREYERV